MTIGLRVSLIFITGAPVTVFSVVLLCITNNEHSLTKIPLKSKSIDNTSLTQDQSGIPWLLGIPIDISSGLAAVYQPSVAHREVSFVA
eukprot:scaffold29395_cov55-Attheya_sp.AAC.2